MSKPRLYIAGPMRGKPRYNFDAFDRARDFAASKGWEVISPADLDRQEGFDPDTSEFGPEDLQRAIRRDVAAILSLDPATDAILTLPGWEDSVGASTEVALGKWCGLRILTLIECDWEDGSWTFDMGDMLPEAAR